MFDFLVDLKLKGVLTARQACILAFWAKGAGMTGKGSLLAHSPQDQGGNLSKKFDRTVCHEERPEGLSDLMVLGHDRSVLGRARL